MGVGKFDGVHGGAFSLFVCFAVIDSGRSSVPGRNAFLKIPPAFHPIRKKLHRLRTRQHYFRNGFWGDSRCKNWWPDPEGGEMNIWSPSAMIRWPCGLSAPPAF
jgi:hypothetical protein